MGISKDCVYQWRLNDKEFRANMEAVQETALDYAESQLFRNMKAGPSGQASTIFYLKTKGKRRGYIETVETLIGGNGGEAVALDLNISEAEATKALARLMPRFKLDGR